MEKKLTFLHGHDVEKLKKNFLFSPISYVLHWNFDMKSCFAYFFTGFTREKKTTTQVFSLKIVISKALNIQICIFFLQNYIPLYFLFTNAWEYNSKKVIMNYYDKFWALVVIFFNSRYTHEIWWLLDTKYQND